MDICLGSRREKLQAVLFLNPSNSGVKEGGEESELLPPAQLRADM